VIYLQAFVLVLLMGKLMRKVFFGQLRAAEMEHLIERSWYAVTETCLAFTVFRDDFSPKFVALFTLLLFLKCFHWLAEDRVDYFQYAILFSIVINIFIKYILHSIDLQSENPWENKAVYLLYCELLMGSVKVILYIIFMVIMIKIHTFPLFAIRPMYLSMRAFKKAVNDVILSRRAIRNMNTLYPDATPEELATVDNVCIICREEMTGGGSSKKLPCNHIFHATCLRSWFQRQQTCPTCRMDVLRVATPTSTNVPNANVPPAPQEQPQPQPPQPPPFMNCKCSVKVILYIIFMVIMIKIHTFPLFAIRPMYLSMRAFKKAVNDVILSRRAIRNMNTLYPDATPEELATVDNVCIICREEMTGGGSSKKLPCNHIFHATCLRSWFQRQQTCPTCRMDVLRVATPTSTNVPNANVPPAPQEQPQPQPPQPPPFMNCK
ncbi:E3 ubiquitin-protein ligase synoviolin-like, partial [Centruroides sculpturatus]|uniref:E3 ubiquitin-protein ligase synoviolin-like n=1 Tax=Centruroides sculpturatus TaxID=218467 RepID=UPI000C6D0015